MNCMIERTERASAVPVWYIVFFFFRSHQAGTSSHRSSRRSKLLAIEAQAEIGLAEGEQVDRHAAGLGGAADVGEGEAAICRAMPAAALRSSKNAWMSSEELPRPT